MAHPTRKLLLVLLGTVIGVTLTLGHAVLAQDENRSAAEELPLDQLRTFTDVYSRIKDNYVEEIEDEQLLEYAIEGMLNGLDPHSSYLNEEAFRELQIGTQGEFGGLGIEVTMEDGFVRVVAPIDGTPVPTVNDLTADHWRLIQRCYDFNFREVPRMFFDGQTATGVPLGRRLALQALGYGQVALWSGLFAWRGWRAAQ